jgi:hypothetical protein
VKETKLTDALKNLDLPASFYNINGPVRSQISLHPNRQAEKSSLARLPSVLTFRHFLLHTEQ